MPAGMKLPAFTKFTGKMDPEEHVAKFQSQMSFHQPNNGSRNGSLEPTWDGSWRTLPDDNQVGGVQFHRILSRAFPDRVQPRSKGDQKIAIIAFVEGLRMRKFKESHLKKRPQDLEEVNEREYKYNLIEEVEKRDEKGRGKRPLEDDRRRIPEPKRWSALDRIRAPD
ncbi:hypothetical protein LIER_35170 [Lithospermum erythrorhizon]|uniref:Reverse transcriptase domain-containing protein n=1 Tax=Lithospermum erythrorhizon TaxID=34254 RepID=A0AAV3NQK5_LITER